MVAWRDFAQSESNSDGHVGWTGGPGCRRRWYIVESRDPRELNLFYLDGQVAGLIEIGMARSQSDRPCFAVWYQKWVISMMKFPEGTVARRNIMFSRHGQSLFRLTLNDWREIPPNGSNWDAKHQSMQWDLIKQSSRIGLYTITKERAS